MEIPTKITFSLLSLLIKPIYVHLVNEQDKYGKIGGKLHLLSVRGHDIQRNQEWKRPCNVQNKIMDKKDHQF